MPLPPACADMPVGPNEITTAIYRAMAHEQMSVLVLHALPVVWRVGRNHQQLHDVPATRPEFGAERGNSGWCSACGAEIQHAEAAPEMVEQIGTITTATILQGCTYQRTGCERGIIDTGERTAGIGVRLRLTRV